ncbi:DUF7845 domain-containing protein [Halogeometricum pallidum]
MLPHHHIRSAPSSRGGSPPHRLMVEVKHYYAREGRSKSKDDHFRHPTIGVSYQISR